LPLRCLPHTVILTSLLNTYAIVSGGRCFDLCRGQGHCRSQSQGSAKLASWSSWLGPNFGYSQRRARSFSECVGWHLFSKNRPTLSQDITVVRAKMPPLVRSGDAGTGARQGARAIARDMLGQMSAPLDQPVLPFDDSWIREIKVSIVQPVPCVGSRCRRLDSAIDKCESCLWLVRTCVFTVAQRSSVCSIYECDAGWNQRVRTAWRQNGARNGRPAAQPRHGRRRVRGVFE